MPTSVRLDKATERLLRRLVNRSACSKSQIIRRAIEQLAAAEGLDQQPPRAYELVADLLGCVSGGPPELSADTGRQFAELLAARRGSAS